jgi:putative ABC transport system permease protein
MLKNYFKTSWRSLTRNKIFSFINISGLALGLTCSLLIFLWVKDERRIDSFHQQSSSLYGVYETIYDEGRPETGHWTPGRLAEELKRKIPEIKYASGFWNWDDERLFTFGDKNIAFKGGTADSDFFKMFSYPLLQGSAAASLADPDAIAISHGMANAFFGSPAAAMGKTLRYDNNTNFKVSAVFELPAAASQKFDFLVNWAFTLRTINWLNEWAYRTPSTFIQLQAGAHPEKVEAAIKDFVRPYLRGAGVGFRIELGLQRFDEMYLHDTFKNGRPEGGRIEYVQLFSAVAIIILIIACINFMNLATARSVKRAKEVGVRKTIGAGRGRLVIQFIGEAMLLAFIAVVIALILVRLTLPSFNQLTAKQIRFPSSSPGFWLTIGGLTAFTGLVAGSYPALYLSSLNPLKVLKGSLTVSPGAILARRGLVVFQFVMSIALITGTMIISQQIHYVQSANLGYTKDNLVYVPFQGNLARNYKAFKDRLEGMPGILAVTRSSELPTEINAHSVDLDWTGRDPNSRTQVIHNTVGHGFLPMMGLQILQGRDFSPSYDSDGFIINQSAARLIGYKDPIGKPLSIFGMKRTIVGVVQDFHLRSLHYSIQPLVLLLNDTLHWGNALVKVRAGETKQALASMRAVFKQMEPQYPFRYSFADADYAHLYEGELTVSNLADSFSFLAIFISCLGLLGLAIFTAEQRRKEIGIRKVVGASTVTIVTLLSKDIIKLVALSAIIATPIAWVVMHSWLQSFAYRIKISWWSFAAAGIVALLIAQITISYQAVKAAMMNPVKSLRTD